MVAGDGAVLPDWACVKSEKHYLRSGSEDRHNCVSLNKVMTGLELVVF